MSVSCQTKFSADTTNRAVIGAEIKFTIATLYFTRLPVSGLQSLNSNHKRNILTCVCYEHISTKVIRQLWLREILAMMFVKNITFIREPCHVTLEICQNFYTTIFLDQKFYTLKMLTSGLFLLTINQRKCINITNLVLFCVKIYIKV